MRRAGNDHTAAPRTSLLTTAAAIVPEAVPAAVCAAAVVLVLLLDVGRMTNALAFPLSLVAALVAVIGVTILVRRTRSVERSGRWSTTIDLLALAAAVLAALINARYASQHVLVDRDPAVYTTTAQWLVHHSSLPATDDFATFGPTVNAGRIGWGYVPSAGGFYPQGMHGVPVLAAMVGRVGGAADALRANALLGGVGLLAIYAFARTLVARGWALVVAVALGVSMPQIHFTRDTYSESLGQLAVWVGLALFARARTTPRIWPLALVGLVFGASMVSRTDAFLGFVCVAAMALTLTAFARDGLSRGRTLAQAAALVAATVLAFLVGFYDLKDHAGSYFHDLHSQLRQVAEADVAAFVLAIGIVLVAWFGGPLRAQVSRRRGLLGVAAGVLLALIFVVLAARPLFQTKHGIAPPTNAYIGSVQKADGLALDPTRTYTENSVEWMSYYLGPLTTALGLLGICLLARRLLARGQTTLVPFLGLFLPVTLGYFLMPNISPDQIWAARRYLPIVMPGLLIGTVVVLELVLVVAGRARAVWLKPTAAALAVVVGAAAVVVPLVISRPLLRVREYTLDLELLQKVCSSAGPKGELLALDGPRGEFHGLYLPGLTSYCSTVPNAAIKTPTRAQLAALAARAAAAGRTLTVFTDEADALNGLTGTLPPVPTLVVGTRMWRPEVVRAPHTTTPITIQLWVGRVNADGSVTVVPGAGGLATTFG